MVALLIIQNVCIKNFEPKSHELESPAVYCVFITLIVKKRSSQAWAWVPMVINLPGSALTNHVWYTYTSINLYYNTISYDYLRILSSGNHQLYNPLYVIANQINRHTLLETVSEQLALRQIASCQVCIR